VTIRKIANRTTSLAVSATTTQTGIFKAAVQQSGLISKISNATARLIPKAHLVTAGLIDHLLYDPDGFGLRLFYDYIFINQKPSLWVGKSLTDAFLFTDSILLSTVKNRQPQDSVGSDELIAFLIKTSRKFDHATTVLDRPFLLVDKLTADTQSFADFISLVRIKNLSEDLTAAEQLTRLITAQRIFNDDVGMIDVNTLIDGSTYSLDRHIYDYVVIGSQAEVRSSNDPFERISFFIDKVLDPDMELLSHLAWFFDKPVQEQTQTQDIKYLYSSLLKTDALDLTQIVSYVLGKELNDVTTMLDSMDLGDQLAYDSIKTVLDSILVTERPEFTVAKLNVEIAATQDAVLNTIIKPVLSTDLIAADFNTLTIAKLLSDVTTMLDSMDLGDQLAYDTVKTLTDELYNFDRPYLWLAPRPLADDVMQSDFSVNQTIKANTDSINLAESNVKFLDKLNHSILSLTDIITMARLRDYTDAVTADESKIYTLHKLFADTVLADDPLVRLADGITYYNLLTRYETQPAPDDFSRIVNFYRYPHHGFLSPVTPTEKDNKFVNLTAKTGAFSQVPIWRTNRLTWSEQFDQNYWQKTGVVITPNVVAPPENVTAVNDPTYDANQLQELFYNQPLNTYNNNWFQLVPLLDDTVSDVDFIIASTSTSAHYLTTPTILEFFEGQQFCFSVYAKYAGVKYLRLSAAGTAAAVFDIQNGSIVQRSEDSVIASIQAVGNGFYLCQIKHTITAFGASPELQESQRFLWNQSSGLYSHYEYVLLPASINASVQIELLGNSLETTWTGTGLTGAYVWGAQVETGEQVEQEVSSLNYIRTAGGPRSRLNYRIMPNDSDRVYVGTMLRDGTTLRVSGDQYENVSYILQKRMFGTEEALPTDYFARSVNQSIGPNLNGYTSLAVSVTVGRPDLRRIAGDPQELIAFWFNKDVKKGGTSTAFSYKTIRTNLIRWSERFDYDYWIKINTTATTGISLMAGALPYRNVSLDADQIYGLFHNKKYTYEKYRWWDAVPLKNKPNFTSNAVVDLYESNVADAHQLQTFGFATNLSGDFFASSIYASNANGVNRFRLQVGTVYADFDLSSVSVITSSGTLYTNITTMDAASKWYLCQIIGPTVAIGTFNFTNNLSLSDRISLIQPRYAGNEILSILDNDALLLPNLGKFDNLVMGDQRQGNYIHKEISETRGIPRNRSIDALRVAGIQLYNKTSSSVNLARFTPLSTEDSIYYRANEWWSELPNYTRARFAIGNAGTGPNMIDNMQLGDDFTYAGQITLNSSDNFVTLISRTVAILNKQPSLVDNLVTIGGTSGSRRQPTESSSETTKFDFKLNFYENRSIPTIPQYDAEMITGLFYNTRQDIDGTQYTPTSGSYIYRKKTDWYNLVTRFARPRIAFGPGDRRGPVTYDNFQIADGFTYAGTIVLNSQDNFTSPVESISNNFRLDAKLGVFTDLYVGLKTDTTEQANRTIETNAIPAKAWYQLAPLYNDYDHFKSAPRDRDFVRVGAPAEQFVLDQNNNYIMDESETGQISYVMVESTSNKYNSWPFEIIPFYMIKSFADTTTMIDNMELGDDLTYTGDKLLQELLIYGSQYGERNLDTFEKVSFVNQLRAKRGGTRSILTFDISNNTETDAELTAETQSIYPDDWYKLAPYYDTYVNLIDEPTDALDPVRVGSQTSGKRTNADPFEKVSFLLLPKPLTSTQIVESRKGNYTIKELSETRMIPQNPRFDAGRVMGLDLVNKTTSVISLTQYTPISGSTTYYAANDWYSEVPKFNRARFAIGNAGIGPQMLDSFNFGDNLTYYSDKDVDSFVYMLGDSGFRAQTGESTDENTNFFVNKTAKLGVFKDLYIKRDRGLGDYASETTHAENWFQLAPYYDDFVHRYAAPMDTDFVRVGALPDQYLIDEAGNYITVVDEAGKISYVMVESTSNNYNSWPLEIIELLPNKGLSSNHIVVGTSYGGRNQTGMDTSELVKFTTLLNPKRTGTSEATKYGTIRTNFLSYSEDFNNGYWEKVNTTITIPTILMPVSYPYRNTLIDANQVVEVFETDKPYTLNNYYKKWYQSVPLTNRSAVTSNVLNVLSETDVNGPHYIEAAANMEGTDVPYDYFSYSMYVENAGAARNFRVWVDKHWVDYDLNTLSVVTSFGIIYSTIKTVDTSNGVYLCQMIGLNQPVRQQRLLLSLNDIITPLETLASSSRYRRVLLDQNTILDTDEETSGVDLLGASGSEDLESLSGTFDLFTP